MQYHTQEQTDLYWRDAIVSKMRAENAVDTSDAEIRRIFDPTVAPVFCIGTATRLREKGLLNL